MASPPDPAGHDSTTTTSVTRTLPGERMDALASAVDAVRSVHGEPHAENLADSPPSVRWRLPDDTRLTVTAGTMRVDGTTPVTLTWERLDGPERLEQARREALELLESAVGRD